MSFLASLCPCLKSPTVDNELQDVSEHSDPLARPTGLQREGFSLSHRELPNLPRQLSLEQCNAMTQNFTCGLLGRGSFGRVYRGEWMEGKVAAQVAVKRLDAESFQGQEEWMNEILLLSQIEHPNVVPLLGHCGEGGESLLVYPLCSNGSLSDAIFGGRSWKKRTLTWQQRVHIAQDVAKGLLFLHQHSVIHRDFKAANVLLTQDMTACITDFGLARVLEDNGSHLSTRVLGTLGYLDPAYMETGHLTFASDIYSFGVFLLELISGQHGDDADMGELVVNLQQHLQKEKIDVGAFIDDRLIGEYDEQVAMSLAAIAKHCVNVLPDNRPDILDIEKQIQGLVNKPILP